MRVVDLRQKEVINICTCKTLGCPIDVEFNPKTGHSYRTRSSGSCENSAAFSATARIL